ncbi:MAG: SET domain-containing protein [Crocinitomicaceae bacterium]|nr:SET domain-containing protein [Crocinitomicaceae bacterium]
MIHPDTKLEFISETKGYGVVATRRIPKGTITWVQDNLDTVISEEKVRQLGSSYFDIIDTYTFRDSAGNHVLCWDHGKYVNHSFNANCLTTAYNFEIAIRDIEVGEELTDDYGYLNITSPFHAEDEAVDRKVVYPDDLKTYYPIWDEKLENAFQWVNKVPQALQHMLNKDQNEEIEAVLNGHKKLESILNCYYESDK